MKKSMLGWGIIGLLATSSLTGCKCKPKDLQTYEPLGSDIESAWQAMGSVGEEHEALKALVGEWSATTKHFMAPGEDPFISSGTTKRTWEFGGRVIIDHTANEPMAEGMPPYEGKGWWGYNNLKKTYWLNWLDSMSTASISGEGNYDPTTQSFTFMYTMDDPLTGKPLTMRHTVTIVNNDEHVMKMYDLKGGVENMVMEITFKRQK